MKINRFEDLKPYAADNHFDMRCLRVQGHDASPAQTGWIGLSWLLPNGHTSIAPSPVEKMYVVLEGSVIVNNGNESATLSKFDSCYFAPGEARQLTNESSRPAAVLLVMPYTDGTNAVAKK